MRKANMQSGLTAMLALSAVLVASCAEVEAEIPEAQVTQKGVSFHGMGRGDGWDGEVAATQTFALSSANLSWVKDLNSKIYLTQIDLRPASGVKDLSFIHYARAVMAGDHKTMPVELVNYVRPDHQDETPVLEAKSPSPGRYQPGVGRGQGPGDRHGCRAAPGAPLVGGRDALPVGEDVVQAVGRRWRDHACHPRRKRALCEDAGGSMIGIIGGTGLGETLGALGAGQSHTIDTPFGMPSGPIITTEIGGVPVALLSRHGRRSSARPVLGSFPRQHLRAQDPGRDAHPGQRGRGQPARQDRAARLGAARPGHRQDLLPAGLVLRRLGGARRDGEPLLPDLAQPTGPAWAPECRSSCTRVGTYVCMEGPQFSTRAESEMHRAWGADLIGMTLLPEAKLAREAEICYAAVALVTDYDCWRKRIRPRGQGRAPRGNHGERQGRHPKRAAAHRPGAAPRGRAGRPAVRLPIRAPARHLERPRHDPRGCQPATLADSRQVPRVAQYEGRRQALSNDLPGGRRPSRRGHRPDAAAARIRRRGAGHGRRRHPGHRGHDRARGAAHRRHRGLRHGARPAADATTPALEEARRRLVAPARRR